jgi:6-phosphogluconolactonase/glucosamine-6-phosphate isomerase/deaminase
MEIIVKPDAAALSEAVADRAAAFINRNPGALVCLAAGDTPLPAYRRLIALQAEGAVDLSSVYYVGLDEWVGLGRETRGSCLQVMYDGFYGPAGIPEDRIVAWNGLNRDIEGEIARIEAWIEVRGGIAFTILGIGMNGHVGFNEPGTGLPLGCIRVELDETTRRVSKKYFDSPLPVESGVGVGAGELKKAREILLVASGAHKAEVALRVAKGAPDASVPASLMADHPNIFFMLDEKAARLL